MTRKIILYCVAVIAVILTFRIAVWMLPPEAITLLTGAAMGVLVAVPCTAVCTWLVMTQPRGAEPEQWMVEREDAWDTQLATPTVHHRDDTPVESAWRIDR